MDVEIASWVQLLNELYRLCQCYFPKLGYVVIVQTYARDRSICVVLDSLSQCKSPIVFDFIVSQIQGGQIFINHTEWLR